MVLTANGRIFSWRNNEHLQLGLGFSAPDEFQVPSLITTLDDVVSITCGYEHSVALTSEGAIYTWGHGEGGLLGHGDQDSQGVPKMVDEFK